MPALSFQLFGKFQVSRDGRALDSVVSGKVCELLCYLLLKRGRPHPRETLAGLLWGDSTTAQSKKYLRKALWQLRAALAAACGSSGSRLLQVDSGWVMLSMKLGASVDVAEFEQAFATVRGRSAREITKEQAGILQSAMDLYQGDLLEGWYQDWCLYDRERLQNIYLSMLSKLMAYCENQQQYEAALDYGNRILVCDRAHELTHQRMMRLYALAGDRASALRQYKRCCEALRQELEIQPSQGTAELFREICADRVVATRDPSNTPLNRAAGASAPADALDRLKDLMAVLSEVQRTLKDEFASLRKDARPNRVPPRSSAA